MTIFVLRNGEFIDRELAPPLVERHGEGPHIINDSMPELRHMADGKYYSSKAKFREVTKAHDCQEVGSETAYMLKPRKRILPDRYKRRDDIKKAIYELKNKRK